MVVKGCSGMVVSKHVEEPGKGIQQDEIGGKSC